jgi:hypothetical protein
MIKKIFLVLFILILLGAAGAWYYFNNQTDPETGQKKDMQTAVEDTLVKAVSMTCEYTDDQGKQAKTYVKNGAIRSESIASNPQDSANVIVKDKKIYFWNPSTKEGFMMKVPEEGETPDQSMPQQAAIQAENIVSGLEANKDSCKPSIVSDDLFVVPTDVTFNDPSKMMQQLPTGIDESQMTEEQKQQLEKMMQEYQQR